MKVLGIVYPVIFFVVLLASCTSKPPQNLGLLDKKFSPCPDKPNCVSSFATDQASYIKPFTYSFSREKAQQRLSTLISRQKNWSIVQQSDDYWHIECKSAWLQFVDDLEIYFPEDEQQFHIKSASRLGYSDLGVNRRRLETLRLHWHQFAQ